VGYLLNDDDGDLKESATTVIYLIAVYLCHYLMPLSPRFKISCNDVGY
jgi:hypothetical protein